MGFFDNVDVSDIPDNPNYVEDGTYLCKVVSAKTDYTKNKEKGIKKGLTLKWQILDEQYAHVMPISEWIWVPEVPEGEEPTAEDKSRLSRLIQHFKAMNFGADEYGAEDFGDDDLINREAMVRFRNKPDGDGVERANVTGVFPVDEEGSDAGMEHFLPNGSEA